MERKFGSIMQKASTTFFYFFILFGFLSAHGQVSFEAKASKNKLGLNERLRIDFEMNENGDNFNPPDFSGFLIVSGPQQSVSRSWVNGVQSFSKTYTYFLTPKKKGKIVLGQAEVNINGESILIFDYENFNIEDYLKSFNQLTKYRGQTIYSGSNLNLSEFDVLDFKISKSFDYVTKINNFLILSNDLNVVQNLILNYS